MPNYYGYIRVSSKDQNEDRQLVAMREVPIHRENIYIDKQSGKDFNRPAYKSLVRKMRKDDVLYIKSIDRLGRNYQEILDHWQMLTKKKGVDIVVMDMPLLDTRCGKDLIGTFIADLVLQVLSFVAENERSNIRQRQAEGIAAAKARGVKFGRPPIPRPVDYEAQKVKYENLEISARQAGRALGVTHKTFLKWFWEDAIPNESKEITNGTEERNSY